MGVVIDNRLLDPYGDVYLTENFNRVLAIIDNLQQQDVYLTENFNRVLAIIDNLQEQVDTVVPNVSIIFNPDGGTPTPEVQQIKAHTTAIAPDNPTKEGYVFNFWSIDGTNEFDFDTHINGDITLTAIWAAEEE